MSEFSKLLDNERPVLIFKNKLGSYTALVMGTPDSAVVEGVTALMDWVLDAADDTGQLTDDFTPEAAIARLAEKVFQTGEYQNGGKLNP